MNRGGYGEEEEVIKELLSFPAPRRGEEGKKREWIFRMGGREMGKNETLKNGF